MKKTLLFTSLSSLLITSFVSAQQTTFDFTTGAPSGTGFEQTWSQTVNGITCTVSSSNPDFLSVGTNPIINAGSTDLVSSEGLWMGRFIPPVATTERYPFHRPGASITFSHDVRLKSYTFGRQPYSQDRVSFCYLQGGNVTALAYQGGFTDPYQGTRSFALEAVIPAGTPLITCIKHEGTGGWRFASLTVEPETYVEPDIQIPEGNETGVTRVGSSYSNSGSDYKNSFALKNGRLLAWGHSFYSTMFHFDGAGSGVLDFWLSTQPTLLVETVEGFALFSDFKDDDSTYNMHPLSGTLPANPDQVDLSMIGKSSFVMALKDGEVYFDGPAADAMRDAIPAEIAAGGVSEIAAALETALAVKDGKLYMWGAPVPGTLAISHGSIPAEVANGEVVHLAADGTGAFVQLSTGELIKFGSTSVQLSAEQTAGTEIFADLIAKDGNLMTLRQDGSFYVNDRYTHAGNDGHRYNRYGYDEVPFYVDPATSRSGEADYNLRGLEAIPTIIQKLGYDQLALANENIIATTPSGRVVIWGGTDVNETSNSTSGENPIQGDSVPTQINEILFPQTNVARLVQSTAPDAAELSMLGAGRLGIQWGESNTPYEVQTTTDILGGEWESLPTDANNRFYRINPVPSN